MACFVQLSTLCVTIGLKRRLHVRCAARCVALHGEYLALELAVTLRNSVALATQRKTHVETTLKYYTEPGLRRSTALAGYARQ